MAAVSELSSRLAGDRVEGRRQANYMPVKFIMAFEHYVVYNTKPDYSCYYA